MKGIKKVMLSETRKQKLVNETVQHILQEGPRWNKFMSGIGQAFGSLGRGYQEARWGNGGQQAGNAPSAAQGGQQGQQGQQAGGGAGSAANSTQNFMNQIHQAMQNGVFSDPKTQNMAMALYKQLQANVVASQNNKQQGVQGAQGGQQGQQGQQAGNMTVTGNQQVQYSNAQPQQPQTVNANYNNANTTPTGKTKTQNKKQTKKQQNVTGGNKNNMTYVNTDNNNAGYTYNMPINQ